MFLSHSLVTRFRRWFLTGLVVIIPGVVATAAVLWLFDLLTGGIPALAGMLPFPRLQEFVDANPLLVRIIGLLALVVLITLVGVLTANVVGQKIVRWLESLVLRVPVFSPIYSTVKQIGDAFSSTGNGMFRSVVLFEYPIENVYVLGFVTAEAFRESKRVTGKDLVSVFVPTTPNPTSGFLYFVVRDRLKFVDMSVTEAMRLIISGGVVRPDSEQGAVPVTNPAAPPGGLP